MENLMLSLRNVVTGTGGFLLALIGFTIYISSSQTKLPQPETLQTSNPLGACPACANSGPAKKAGCCGRGSACCCAPRTSSTVAASHLVPTQGSLVVSTLLVSLLLADESTRAQATQTTADSKNLAKVWDATSGEASLSLKVNKGCII